MRTRVRLSFAGLILGVVIAALGPGATARAGEIGTTPPEACNPTGRQICITLRTFEGITASDPTRTDGKRFTWVEWKLRNGGGSKLTHPAATVSIADLCDAVACAGPSTAQFALPLPSGCTLQGSNLVCTYPSLAAGAETAFTRAFFKTADRTAARPVTAGVVSVTAEVKERSNDGNPCASGDPNCDTFTNSITNSYEPDPNAAFTFSVGTNRFHLPTNDGLSSFSFTGPGTSGFLASFRKLSLSESAAFCFSITCTDRALEVSTQGVLSFGVSTPMLFFSRLLNASGAANKVSAVHFYDSRTLAVLAGNRLTPGTTPSFARMDGVRFASPAFGLAAGNYFVRYYQSSDNSFQLSSTKDGPILTLALGAGSGEPIRIIGDETEGANNERSDTLCSTSLPPASTTMPKICTKKVGPVIEAYLWDSGNGRVNW